MKKNNPVKGLIIYTFYSANGNITMISPAIFLLGIIMAVTGTLFMYQIYMAFGIAVLSCTLIMNAHKDSASKWSKFQLALPVKRSNVVTANYLGHLFMLFASILLAGILIGLGVTLNESLMENISGYVFTYIAYCVGISLVACAVFYPIIYTVGASKEEGIYTVSLLAAGGFLSLIWWMGRWYNISYTTISILQITISSALFTASYLLTTKIYAKKDL